MQGMKFQQSYHLHGTLAADANIRFNTDADMTLTHVSAKASNNSDATLKIGTSDDDDAYLQAAAIGDSDTLAEFGLSNFVDGEHPHILKGTTVVVSLDHDGAAGTAAQNVTLVLTFGEG